MKQSVQISEIQKAQALIADRLKGTETLPMAIAMLFEGISLMRQLGHPANAVRELVARALAVPTKVAMPRIVEPTKDQVSKVLGPYHDKKKDS